MRGAGRTPRLNGRDPRQSGPAWLNGRPPIRALGAVVRRNASSPREYSRQVLRMHGRSSREGVFHRPLPSRRQIQPNFTSPCSRSSSSPSSHIERAACPPVFAWAVASGRVSMVGQRSTIAARPAVGEVRALSRLSSAYESSVSGWWQRDARTSKCP